MADYLLVRLSVMYTFHRQHCSVKFVIRSMPKPYRQNLILLHIGSKILQYLSKRMNNVNYRTLGAEYTITLNL
jgi:hypothetical protein